jgi:hypothetical protein
MAQRGGTFGHRAQGPTAVILLIGEQENPETRSGLMGSRGPSRKRGDC